MKFYSTNRQSDPVSLKEAIFQSLPQDNGLYYPEYLPDLSFLNDQDYSLPELGFEILKPFCKGEITDAELQLLIEDALDFEIPLVEVEKDVFSLELFHGPTLAFKDVGARILARLIGHYNQKVNEKVFILVATSGDTGGAVAAGFHQVEGVEVVILYPSGKVSELQEKQLTTLGSNIHALEVKGTFDDCQALVKTAFLDGELNEKINLSSANSINIARWIPQSIYYFWSCQQLKDQELVFAVPSGNYGNLAAGILAKKMGAPINRFIATSNANDVVPRFLESGTYDPRDTIQTYSNAMDVGNPSNFPRMKELYQSDYESMIQDISGDRLGDEQTLSTIRDCYLSNEYLLDPHGAIGYYLLKKHLRKNETGVFLETAHPCKFLPVIQRVVDYELPPIASHLIAKQKEATLVENDYQELKSKIFDIA